MTEMTGPKSKSMTIKVITLGLLRISQSRSSASARRRESSIKMNSSVFWPEVVCPRHTDRKSRQTIASELTCYVIPNMSLKIHVIPNMNLKIIKDNKQELKYTDAKM